MINLIIKNFSSEEEMMKYVNSPEVMGPINAYIDQVHADCTKGLSPENKQLYHDWHSGKYRPTREEQEQCARENPELYNSIMASISMGLG